MDRLTSTWGRRWRSVRRRLMLDWGATMPEYALMVGLILLVALLGAQSLGLAVKFRFDEAVRLWPG